MNDKITNKTLVQIALITGVVVLASLGVSGWGWLIFLLFITS
jgi:hypothetical protein